MKNTELTISNKRRNNLSDRLLDFAVQVIRITDMLPNTVAGRHVGGQLMKAGTSGGSNYEEACGAESRPDFAHKMGIVLKELKESRFWLRLIHRTKMVAPEETEPVSLMSASNSVPSLQKASSPRKIEKNETAN